MRKIIISLFILLGMFNCSSSILDDPTTTIQFSVSERSYVKLTVENSYNTLISTLVDRELETGQYRSVFDADNLAEGVYYYTLEVQGLVSSNYNKKTRTMLLVK